MERSNRGAVGDGPMRILRVESLEDRRLLSVLAAEQEFVYLLNRARHDPVAYEIEQGLSVDLSYVDPRPPLAVNDSLFASARFHAEEMAEHDYFAHQSAVTGDWPNKMARDHGYALPSWYPVDGNNIESLAAGTWFTTAIVVLNALIVDEGVDPPGHRNHLLGIGDFWAASREIGVGYAYNSAAYYDHYWAVHATRTDPAGTFLTGVVYDDANGNKRYDAGEGLGGVAVAAGAYATTTNAAGGWALEVGEGTYTVSASGGALGGPASVDVSVVGDNVEVDFIAGRSWGLVDFDTARPLGTVDFVTRPAERPADGTLEYRFHAARDAVLTAQLSGEGVGPGTEMTLYRRGADRSLQQLAVGSARIDWETTAAGEEYVLHVAGLTADVDLTLANLVSPAGADVTVYGTDGGDAFEASGTSFTINGLAYSAAQFVSPETVRFVAGDGFDVARLTGSAGSDQITLAPHSAELAGGAIRWLVDGAEQIDVDGAGGDDEAWLDGTGVAGGYLRLWPLYGTWTAAGEPFNHTLANVATVHALADGGDDTAALYDSKGDDVFYGGPASPHGTRFVGTTPGRVFDNEVVGYANVYAYARAGGNDAAELYDSNTSADSFFGKPGDGTFYGPGFYLRAIGFERVNARASDDGFADAARLYDSDGDDTFYAGPTSPEGTTMAGTTAAGWSYANAVSGFRYVTGYSENGGADVAHLYDSDASRDYYVAKQEYVTLYGSTFSSTVLGFDDVRGYASDDGFNDTAFLNDSDGDDTFDAGPRSPEGTRLSGTTLGGRTYSFAVEGFRAVSAFATAGGSDRAEMYDSDTSRDVFVGAPGDSTIKGPDFTCRAVGFHEVSAYASPNDGFDDVAQLYDSDGDDVFYAGPTSPEGTKLVGTTLAGWTFSNSADGFRYVYGYAKAGGNDVAEFYDAAGSDDAFVGKPAYGVLYGPEFQLRASLFEQVNVYASDPGDRAKLYDSDGDDAFHAGPSSPVGTRLSGTTLAGHGFAHTLAGFYYVNAYAYAGGSDRVYLYGSAGAVDYLSASLEGRYAKFYDGMSYRVHAERFERYEVRGTPGDNDQASLFDSSGNDHVEGDATIDPALAVLIGAGQRYDLYDFGRVKVTGSTGTDTKHVVAALDYVLQTVGTWIDV